MRKLKYHEQKLLKKQDFYDWKNIQSLKKAEITRKYRLSSRNDYDQYAKIVGYVTKIAQLIEKLPQNDSFKKSITDQLLKKLFDTGLITTKENLELAKKLTVSAFLRRRFILMVKKLKFVETLQEGETFIQHGHFMIGNQVIKDPDFLISRNLEDHITWNDKSKIKKKIEKFKNKYDDYELNQQIHFKINNKIYLFFVILIMIKNSAFNFGLQKAYRKGNIINPHIKKFRVLTPNNPGQLGKILQRIQKFDVDITDIESNFINNKSNECYFDFSYQTYNDSISVDIIKESLKYLDTSVEEMKPQKVPNFPISLYDLDNFPDDIQFLPGQDHPGKTDKEYINRRNQIANLNQDYKIKTPIAYMQYTEQETELWNQIFLKLKPLIEEHACIEFVDNFKLVQKDKLFQEGKVPQQEDIRQYLLKKSNWKITPVSGIISQRLYLNCLAFRVFCCTQYLRHPSRPFYTPEPDIFHEYLGHVPMFIDETFCNVSQQLGILSLGASDSLIKLIGNIYWFTIEFGLIKQNNKMKFYGAGVASSVGEIENFQKCKDFLLLNLRNNFPDQEVLIEELQKSYYYIESFDDILEQLIELTFTIKKPFKYSFDDKSEFLYLDRSIQTFDE